MARYGYAVEHLIGDLAMMQLRRRCELVDAAGAELRGTRLAPVPSRLPGSAFGRDNQEPGAEGNGHRAHHADTGMPTRD